MQTRKVKVQAQHRPGTMYPPRRPRRTAKLTLAGQWLEAAGFPPGVTAHIEITADGLFVRPTPAA